MAVFNQEMQAQMAAAREFVKNSKAIQAKDAPRLIQQLRTIIEEAQENIVGKEKLQGVIGKGDYIPLTDKSGKENMTTKIKWAEEKVLKFKDVPFNSNFVIDGRYYDGKLYRKVNVIQPMIHAQMDEETGEVRNPTEHAVRVVDVEINVQETK